MIVTIQLAIGFLVYSLGDKSCFNSCVHIAMFAILDISSFYYIGDCDKRKANLLKTEVSRFSVILENPGQKGQPQ
jgi:hypothetical protein